MSIKNLLPANIGLGGAPLGNMFRNIPEDEALATVHDAWKLGVRYFDTAPLYGHWPLNERPTAPAFRGPPTRPGALWRVVCRREVKEEEPASPVPGDMSGGRPRAKAPQPCIRTRPDPGGGTKKEAARRRLLRLRGRATVTAAAPAPLRPWPWAAGPAW